MQSFYKRLVATSGDESPYLKALKAIMGINPGKLAVMGDVPGWQVW